MFLLKLLSRLPLSFLYLFSPIIYFFLYKVFAYRKQIVKENLELAFPNEALRKEMGQIQTHLYI